MMVGKTTIKARLTQNYRPFYKLAKELLATPFMTCPSSTQKDSLLELFSMSGIVHHSLHLRIHRKCHQFPLPLRHLHLRHQQFQRRLLLLRPKGHPYLPFLHSRHLYCLVKVQATCQAIGRVLVRNLRRIQTLQASHRVSHLESHQTTLVQRCLCLQV